MRSIVFLISVSLALFLRASTVFAAGALVSREPPAAVIGIVQDAESGEPLGWVSVILIELEYGVSSHANGEFHLFGIAPGSYTLRVTRIGYRQLERSIILHPADTLRLTFKLSASPVLLGAIETVAASDTSSYHSPVVEMLGGELQRELGTTVAETVDEHPGVAQRSMGPAPARPVLRGLGGDRLLILEDNHRTGDLSASSADHAVAIEPVTAERIEIVRGPETALYGPIVLGGVINVERGLIVTGLPHRVHGTVTGQMESVNRGVVGGLGITCPIRSFAVRADVSLRSAADLHTPDGNLRNTSLHTGSGGVGVSLIRSWGVIGGAGSLYETQYGIPGGFIGAHPNGVSIELNRRNLKLRAIRNFGGSLVRRLEAEYAFARYYHAEYESNGALGMEFGVLSSQTGVHAHLERHLIFDEGVIGADGEVRNYATGGLTNTPATDERQGGVFVYEKKRIHRLSFEGALRYDHRETAPAEERASYFIGQIRRRAFGGLSGSLAATVNVKNGMTIGAAVSRSWRAPTIEELFSEGPHLAAYAYELGNPNLNAERGLSCELRVERKTERLQWTAAVYRNAFADYIFPRNTGRLSPRRADLYEYRYAGQDAVMFGGEARLTFEMSHTWLLRMSGSYVRGELSESDVALPMMPPLAGGAGCECHVKRWVFILEARGASAQKRVSEFEEPTAAWLRFDVNAQYQQAAYGLLHTITFAVENVTETEYRNHLSRVKIVMPEPGRNVKLIYRVNI